MIDIPYRIGKDEKCLTACPYIFPGVVYVASTVCLRMCQFHKGVIKKNKKGGTIKCSAWEKQK